MAIAQDGSGFIWLGTQNGLSRWDGYRFRRYAADAKVPGSLPDSPILALHTDLRGRLWIGTAAGGLARFDAAGDAFVSYAAGPGGLKAGTVTAITGDGAAGLWIGTSAGLDHLNADDRIEPMPAGGDAALALPEGGVQALLTDRAGTLWAGTQRGLFRRTAGTRAFAEVPLPLPNRLPVPVSRLYQDASGRVWIGTRGHGAFVVEPESQVARAVLESTRPSTLGGETVLGIVEAVPGEIWLGTYGAGIVAIAANGNTRRIRRHAGIATSLGDDDVLALHRDRSGLVWVASINAFSRHDPQQRTVLALRGDDGPSAAGIRSPNVSSVLARPDGRVWLGVGSDGIDILDAQRGRVGQLRSDAAHPSTALPNARVLSMVSTAGGDVFIGTRQGLYLSDANGRGVLRLNVPTRGPDATVWSLCMDGGVLWLGGFDGLWALDASVPERLRVLRHEPAARLGVERVVALQRGSGNSLWVGTEQGLVHVDVKSGAIEPVIGEKADPLGVPLGWVSSMLVDTRGRLWVSSYNNGVLLLQGRDGSGRPRFRRLGSADGLINLGVNKLLEDRRGNIWASTDDGLAVIDADTLAINNLGHAQGVEILSYWTNSGAATADGELLFGGQGGVSVVRPERLATWPLRPAVVVTDGQVGAGGVERGRFDASHGWPGRLDMPPEARGFWLEFSALDFSAPELNRYAHRLRGFDADWIATDATHRMASYTNLPPGDYTLELRGSNRDGVWTEPPLALPIRVLPAWYQTLWFRGLVGACGLLLVALLVQARTLLLRRRQCELEALVAQRTADLQLRSAELHESQRQLEKIAYADALTGLPNRRRFNDDLRHEVAQALRAGPPFVLLVIDLDGFKRVNDTLGHDAGDALLVATAARLLGAMRGADRVARMGGDEFALLLTQDPDTRAVDSVCHRIIAGLAEPVSFHDATLQVSASIGVAMCPAHGNAPDLIYKAADLALYEAKGAGRNTWRWHSRPTTDAATCA